MLAARALEVAADDDLLLFLDGDALPLAPVDESVLAGAPLAAVRLDESLGDRNPHPCFCLARAGTWRELGGDWREGPTWVNARGDLVTDVGGRLLDKQPVGLGDALIDAVNLFGLLIAANLLALLLYPFAGPLVPVVFWGVNGLLLGREYFMLVAMRRLGRAGAKALRARHAGQIWLAGALMAAPLSVPLLNLVVPVLGVATFTHLFHRLNRA